MNLNPHKMRSHHIVRLYSSAATKATTAAPQQPPPPPLNPSSLQYTTPILSTYSTRLASHTSSIKSPRWTYKGPPNTAWRHAAILIPLCTAHGKPSILFTMRSSKLRRHGGEVSFPGGAVDPGDKDVIATALRETHEEILIPPDHVTVLGQFHPLPDRTHSILIHPILSHIHTPHSLVPESMPFNPTEVEEVFCVSLEELLGMQTETEHLRGGKRLVRNWNVGEKRIWGLTAWVLEAVLRVVVAPGGVSEEWREAWRAERGISND
ncbi:uncharacterized protein SPPG_01831 [Spizellomyces punctatus DAOM BR117]|uniref:Nudix hydrolase domain-containing protein n=1 Tax=Spizellomyces punctatus (strain DAOM BR117) TaxID=645134 RepID=A0A0L0HNW6_SPIPD|nr:uncharacterized protein SPPG_01831 [Spizellomyces punctatus DAOM BR117]KND02748.1 hypothetical protein SPPG_01831 [Spizellomyces punctatus DAOM BR117]|eukprot:XP_016610787.1 hypothetical protein SPPG_01831 [Spizellomyces punctatus DAOM BR117]